MKLRDLKIFQKDSPQIDEIFDESSQQRYSITFWDCRDYIITSDDAEQASYITLQDTEDLYSLVKITMDEEVEVDAFGALLYPDFEEEEEGMHEFYFYTSQHISLI